MAIYSFRTIKRPANAEYKELGSKFLAFAYPASTEEEIKEKLAALKKKYFDAHHHCYAWMLGPNKTHFRAADDGEPHHSAGDPILGQIRAKDITDVLVVVVRYFGRTKLGVGGLVQAYRTAASMALDQSEMITCDILNTFRINYSYEQTPQVSKVIKDFQVRIVNQQYDTTVSLLGQVKSIDWEKFNGQLTLLNALGASIKIETVDHG